MTGAGTLTGAHSWLKNAGAVGGVHGDFTQFLGGPFTATIKYNTSIESSGASSQGFMVEPDIASMRGVILAGEIGCNLMTGYNNVLTGITVADLTGTFTIDNNYIDQTGTSGGLAFGGVRGGPGDSSQYSIYVLGVALAMIAHETNFSLGMADLQEQ